MKKSLGVALIATLLVLYGFRWIHAGSPGDATGNAIALAMLALSFWLADTIWRRPSKVVLPYACWAAGHLLANGWLQHFRNGEPVAHVLIWWLFVGAALVAVGFHARDYARQVG